MYTAIYVQNNAAPRGPVLLALVAVRALAYSPVHSAKKEAFIFQIGLPAKASL